MTPPQRHPYRPGQKVLVEGVVQDYAWGAPYGAVLVEFPAATDEDHLLDGVKTWQPQALVYVPGVDVDYTDYTAAEGYYEEDA